MTYDANHKIRIKDLKSLTEKTNEKITAIDETITDADKLADSLGVKSAYLRNVIYRGKNLGEFTEDHLAQIKAGTFEDMYLGDYWTHNSQNYTIAGFNYFGSNTLAVWRSSYITTAEASPYSTWYNWAAIGTEGEDGYIPSTINKPYGESNWYVNVRPKFIEIAEGIFGADNLKSYSIIVPTKAGQATDAGWVILSSKAHLPASGMITGWNFIHPRFRDGRSYLEGGAGPWGGYHEPYWDQLPILAVRKNWDATILAENMTTWENSIAVASLNYHHGLAFWGANHTAGNNVFGRALRPILCVG